MKPNKMNRCLRYACGLLSLAAAGICGFAFSELRTYERESQQLEQTIERGAERAKVLHKSPKTGGLVGTANVDNRKEKPKKLVLGKLVECGTTTRDFLGLRLKTDSGEEKTYYVASTGRVQEQLRRVLNGRKPEEIEIDETDSTEIPTPFPIAYFDYGHMKIVREKAVKYKEGRLWHNWDDHDW